MNEAFWKVYKGYLTLDTEGRVFFTKKGRDTYGPLWAQAGMSLGNVKTLEQFQEGLKVLATKEKAKQDDEYRARLADKATDDKEKVYLRRMLGISPEASTAAIIDFRAARLRAGR